MVAGVHTSAKKSGRPEESRQSASVQVGHSFADGRVCAHVVVCSARRLRTSPGAPGRVDVARPAVSRTRLGGCSPSRQAMAVRSGPQRGSRADPNGAVRMGPASYLCLDAGPAAGAGSGWRMFLAALVVFLAGTEVRVRAEDRLLAERFRESFTEYRSRVPAYVPFIR